MQGTRGGVCKSPHLQDRWEETETKTKSKEELLVAKSTCSMKPLAYTRRRRTKGSTLGMPRKVLEQRG